MIEKAVESLDDPILGINELSLFTDPISLACVTFWPQEKLGRDEKIKPRFVHFLVSPQFSRAQKADKR